MLRVITSMNPEQGGPSQGLRNLLPQLEKLGIQSDVVCMDDPHADYTGKDSFRIFALGASKGPWAYNAELLKWLNIHLTEYDAVVVHGLWQYHGYAVRKALNALKDKKNISRPLVFIMPHGMLDPYFQRSRERRLKAIRNIVYWKLIEADIINNADAILFTCEEELLLARQTFRSYKPKKEINVSYGVPEPPPLSEDMQNAFYTVCPQAKTRPYLLFISRLHSKKGTDMLLKAYEKVYSSGDLHEEQIPYLVVAGPGLDTDYGRSLIKMQESSKFLRNHLFFTGMLRGDAKWGALYGCEAFVLPSHQENFGIAVVEAMACGKPVMITDKVNIYREILNSDAGFVATDSTVGTQKLLNEWKSSTDERRQNLRYNARKLYESVFNIESAAEKFKSEINKLF